MLFRENDIVKLTGFVFDGIINDELKLRLKAWNGFVVVIYEAGRNILILKYWVFGAVDANWPLKVFIEPTKTILFIPIKLIDEGYVIIIWSFVDQI